MESTFASRVFEFRRFKGLSQKAFAERCDLEQGNITQMEKGTEPKQSNITKLITGFPDLSADWLLLGNGPMLRDGRSLEPAAPAAPTPGLTSGAATIAEAENVLLRQQLADKDRQMAKLTEMLEWVKNLVPATLGKLLSSSDAAHHGQPYGAVACVG